MSRDQHGPSPHNWNDPEGTQPIPFVRPQQVPWQPIPAGQTPERRRQIWRYVGLGAGLLVLLVVVTFVVYGPGTESSSSSSSQAATSYSVLGCPLEGGVASDECTVRQVISRACDVPVNSLDVQVVAVRGNGGGIERYGPNASTTNGTIITIEAGNPNAGAGVLCKGADTTWPLRTGMWSTLSRAGDPSTLPSYYR